MGRSPLAKISGHPDERHPIKVLHRTSDFTPKMLPFAWSGIRKVLGCEKCCQADLNCGSLFSFTDYVVADGLEVTIFFSSLVI